MRLVLTLLFATLSVSWVLLPFQGYVEENGVPVSEGNVTVYIYDSEIGGNLIYQEDFNDVIQEGYFHVLIGEKGTLELNYGQVYWLDASVNGQDMNFDGNARYKFQATAGYVPVSKLLIDSDLNMQGHNVVDVGTLSVTQIQFPGGYPLLQDGGYLLRVKTHAGYVDIGPGNGVYVHFLASGVSYGFYFNMPVKVNGAVNGTKFVDTDNTNYFLNPNAASRVFDLNVDGNLIVTDLTATGTKNALYLSKEGKRKLAYASESTDGSYFFTHLVVEVKKGENEVEIPKEFLNAVVESTMWVMITARGRKPFTCSYTLNIEKVYLYCDSSGEVDLMIYGRRWDTYERENKG